MNAAKNCNASAVTAQLAVMPTPRQRSQRIAFEITIASSMRVCTSASWLVEAWREQSNMLALV